MFTCVWEEGNGSSNWEFRVPWTASPQAMKNLKSSRTILVFPDKAVRRICDGFRAFRDNEAHWLWPLGQFT